MPELQPSAIARPAPGQPAKIKLTNIEQRFRAADQPQAQAQARADQHDDARRPQSGSESTGRRRGHPKRSHATHPSSAWYVCLAVRVVA